MQKTIKSAITFRGTGLHSGKETRMTVHPAVADHGVWFKRTDVHDADNMIPARYDAVRPSQLCTLLVNDTGVTVSTVEHIMAALAGCGIYNALIEIDGPEVPIVDGSALPFLRGIMHRGIRELAAPVRAWEIVEPVSVTSGESTATLAASDVMQIDFHIDFEDAAIGRQSLSLNMANGSFARELSDSRTFCRQADVDAMQSNGLALGGQPGLNAVVFDGDRVSSPGGLRHADEPVRHKMLDALGDLYLAGAPILGRYVGDKSGHAMTNALLRELFATKGAWAYVTVDAAAAAKLPGAGVSRADVAACA